MKHAFACTLLLCLASAHPAYAKDRPSPPSQPVEAGEHAMNTDQAQVQAVVDTMTAAFQDGKIDTVMSTYAPGAAVAFEPGQPVTDEAQLRQMFGRGQAGLQLFGARGDRERRYRRPHRAVADDSAYAGRSGDQAVRSFHRSAAPPDGRVMEDGNRQPTRRAVTVIVKLNGNPPESPAGAGGSGYSARWVLRRPIP